MDVPNPASPPQPLPFLFQAFYYDLDKVRLLGMGWNVASAGKWVIFCLLCYLMTHLGNHFLPPFFSLCPLQKQIRSVERYIRKLEFHISKVGVCTCTCKGSIHMENTLIIIHLKGRMLGTC